MSSLNETEKRYFQKLLGLETGYVLGNSFNDATFAEFFNCHQINIHSDKYQTHGTSKAKKLRAFWEIELDTLVAKILGELLDAYEADCELENCTVETNVLATCRATVSRLLGGKTGPAGLTEVGFLDREFAIPNLNNLPIESQIATIVEARIKEALIALKANACLSVIFLCGSVLEGVLLGAAQKNPAKFNKAPASPRDQNGKVKQFHEWSLSQLIDVASETGCLKPDVKKFGHSLRDFRNYIHPHQQLLSGFSPDEHTAKICFQVLKAALADLADER